ncbi:hypothetical protein ABVT39_012000 [Epinephelus coioides]
MHFSISCGLSFMCVSTLFFLPAQGTLKCANTSPLVTAAGSKLIDIYFNCCDNVSTTRIREPVKDCYEQMDTFSLCKRHAYILKGNSGRCYCVDPNASWLPERLKRLKTEFASSKQGFTVYFINKCLTRTLKCANTSPLVTAAGSKLIDFHFNCCDNVSTIHIRETVKACYEQMDTFSFCKIHAYILKDDSGRCYCVDPDASWLPERLKRLKTGCDSDETWAQVSVGVLTVVPEDVQLSPNQLHLDPVSSAIIVEGGKFECPNPSPLVTAAGSKLIDFHFNCCDNVSTTRIREPVKDCYEQKAMCKIHAYILEGNSGRCYCVDPDASWLPERLQRLKTEDTIINHCPPSHQMKKALETRTLENSCINMEQTHGDVDAEELVREVTAAVTAVPAQETTGLQILSYIYSTNVVELYPNLSIALRLMVTVSVTVASGERSFLHLKLIKTHLRSTMLQERLSALAQISIEHEVTKSLARDELVVF